MYVIIIIIIILQHPHDKGKLLYLIMILFLDAVPRDDVCHLFSVVRVQHEANLDQTMARCPGIISSGLAFSSGLCAIKISCIILLIIIIIIIIIIMS